MSVASDLRDFAKPILASIANRSGRVLYSAAATLRPGSIYLLGLNPGGDPVTHHDTIADSLRELPSRTINAYVDESWSGQEIGCSRLQRRVCWLIQQLGFNVRDVCAANLIFIRSSNSTGSDYPKLAEFCWPVHERILRIVQPKAVVVFGNSGVSPFRFLQVHYGATKLVSFHSGHGAWQCFGFTAPTGTKVVGLPHLSRYAINKHRDVASWVKEYAAL